ncbi:MAG: ATP-binding protein [Bacteroidota bacterium]
MASRNFYLQLIFRVLAVTLTAMVLAFSYFENWYVLCAFSLFFVGLQAYFLIAYINSTNRKIAYFFDAIRNEDFTLRFPERVAIKSFKELNTSLNRVNSLIQEVHVQLQTREQYYQVILKQANIGIMTFNEQGHIRYSNPTLEKLLNHSPLNHIKQLQRVDPKLYRIFEPFEPFERELFQLTNEREQKQLVLQCTPMVLDNNPLLLVVAQDIHYELDEKETDSWIRLIRVLTHEIMNTITPITSISESILKYYQAPEGGTVSQLEGDKIQSAAKGLEVIKRQGNDLMDFVQSYRSFLSVPKPDKAIVSAKALIDKVKVLMQREHGKDTIISWECEPDALELFLDEKQITQVLINLVKNALHALENEKEGKIQVAAIQDDHGKKMIKVSDNGAGIPDDLIDEIFVPFFTTKDKGTGIGLSLSRQIMQLHGGSLKVYSKPNQETIFTMAF